jgi:molybdopterin-binding protein
MKLSARNMLKGKVVDIDRGQVTAIVRLDIGGGNVITSSVTLKSADELGLKPGADVYAIIKSSEIVLAVD